MAHVRSGFVLALMLFVTPAIAADTNGIVTAWLTAQSKVVTWQAEFQQTRRLPTLTQPLTTTGRVWFRAPNEFRWELGTPARNIAVRHGDVVTMISPRLKLAEIYPVDKGRTGPWSDGLAMMEAGFPKSRAELDSRFIVNRVESMAVGHRVILKPRSESARKLLREVRLEFVLEPAKLLATEFEFADGTVMRNDYRNQQSNMDMSDALFQPAIGDDYRISHPLGK